MNATCSIARWAPQQTHQRQAQRDPAVSKARRALMAPARAAGQQADRLFTGEVGTERQELFNSIAPVYDRLNDLLSLGQHRVWKLATVLWSGATPGDRVLDVCCGSGDIAMLLAGRVGAGGSVVGLDFAAEQLSVAGARDAAQPPAGRCRVEWIEGDAQRLPFADGEFSAATCGYGLRNVASIPSALAELRRVLRPGARAAILDFNNSESEVTRTVQSFFLETLVVPLARANGVAEQYEYLKPSIERFPTGREQEALALEAGFARAQHYELAGGLMGVLVCTTATDPSSNAAPNSW